MLLLTAALLVPAARAQGPNVLSIGEVPTLHLQRGQAAEQKLTLQLRPGFHVNSNKPNDEFLIPLKLTWTPNSAVEAGAVQYPAPKLENSSFSDKPLSVYDGTFQIVTPVRAGAGAAPGAGVLNGKLRYQACNNRECLQPKTVDIKVPWEIE
ncbi:MAG TPA: protein-disulfide reductase DsbD domain-containing protein [Bryobacteraceae bacterium]|nr:protein-disulfide reductase DsbD domain-containing protein [Bryobacteraceae bacterium]